MIQFEIKRVGSAQAHDELKALKEQGYNVLLDLTAIDYSTCPSSMQAPVQERFDIVYRLMKLDATTGEDKGRIEVRCSVPEGAPVLRSIMGLWPIADWLEREIWDMFGIKFADRPDIKRLLLYESFVGHPLRKDYPISKRQPLIGPASGQPVDNPSFNEIRPTVKYE